jgi:hypothetical protein
MPGKPTERFDVANLDQWGRLIKSWATNLDYVSLNGEPEPPRDFWVNKSWGLTGSPAPYTSTDRDADGNPKPWCLPPGAPVPLTRQDGGTVNLPFAVAMTTEDFQRRLIEAGVVVSSMPAQYTNVIIVQSNVDTMVIRLPPKDTLQGSEDDLLSGRLTYPIRSFYSTLYGAPPDMPTDATGIMELHANRIGEYTLNNCM